MEIVGRFQFFRERFKFKKLVIFYAVHWLALTPKSVYCSRSVHTKDKLFIIVDNDAHNVSYISTKAGVALYCHLK